MEMKLLSFKGNEAMVSHRVIALNTENQESTISRVVRKYTDDFNEFGQLLFENATVKNSAGAVNEEKTYFLNEQQATLLLTYLRNSKVVRAFKIKLVKVFYKMKETLYQKTNHHQILGYKSQLSQRNKKISDLEGQLITTRKMLETEQERKTSGVPIKMEEQLKLILHGVEKDILTRFRESLDVTSRHDDNERIKKLEFQNRSIKDILVFVHNNYHEIVQNLTDTERIRKELKTMTSLFQLQGSIKNKGMNLNTDTVAKHSYWDD